MNLGQFKREVEYLDPGLPVEDELVESNREWEAIQAQAHEEKFMGDPDYPDYEPAHVKA